jgi:hypothetical protein
MPVFELGTLATTSRPSFMVMTNALLNMPSEHFLTEMHRAAPIESAAVLASVFKLNLISRFRRFSASSTIKRPRVKLKTHRSNSNLDHVNNELNCVQMSMLTPLRRAHVMGIVIIRTRDSVASSMNLHVECSFEDAQVELSSRVHRHFGACSPLVSRRVRLTGRDVNYMYTWYKFRFVVIKFERNVTICLLAISSFSPYSLKWGASYQSLRFNQLTSNVY